MAASDVEMNETMVNESPFILAPDNAETWANVANLALRHIMRVAEPLRHPEDAIVEGELPHIRPKARSLPVHQPLYALDAHIPAVVRERKTAHFVLQSIRRFSEPLSRRPSDYLAGNSDVWMCPHNPCLYTIELKNLTQDQGETLERRTKDLATPFIVDENGSISASARYVREVIDIVALDHYEAAHLAPYNIKHTVHGQRDDGRIVYQWELDPRAESTVRSMRFLVQENRARINMQRGLRYEARTWAADEILRVQTGERAARARSRQQQHLFAVENYGHNLDLNLDRRDSLFEWRDHTATTGAGNGSISALARLHCHIYDKDTVAFQASEQRRRDARAVSDYWTTGAGAELAGANVVVEA